MYVDPNARIKKKIGINTENSFGVSPEPVGRRLARGWSSAPTTQNSTFTTSKFFLDAVICIPFEGVEVVTAAGLPPAPVNLPRACACDNQNAPRCPAPGALGEGVGPASLSLHGGARAPATHGRSWSERPLGCRLAGPRRCRES